MGTSMIFGYLSKIKTIDFDFEWVVTTKGATRIHRLEMRPVTNVTAVQYRIGKDRNYGG